MQLVEVRIYKVFMNDVINEMVEFEDNPSVQIETSQNP